jgi:hypothetical protein
MAPPRRHWCRFCCLFPDTTNLGQSECASFKQDFVQGIWQACLLLSDPKRSDLFSEVDFKALDLDEITHPSTNVLLDDSTPLQLNLLTPSVMNRMAIPCGEVVLATNEGFVGKDFSTQVKPGDLLCILLGCPVPVALRWSVPYYEFIRAVCVDGTMFGEATEALKRGEVELEDFELH